MTTLAEVDVGWMAAALDGEGCCTANWSGNGAVVSVYVTNKSEAFLEKAARISEVLGYRMKLCRPARGTPHLSVKNLTGIRAVLSPLLPHLTAKAGVAGCMVEFVERRLAKGSSRGRNLPYSEDELALLAMIRELNGQNGHKGPVPDE